MVENKLYRYSKMYYIVSIDDDDKPAFDVVNYVNNELEMGTTFCKKIEIDSVNGWNNAFAEILEDSSSRSIPILFLECHGSRNGTIVFGGRNSTERIRMKDFIAQIKLLEDRCEQKILFATAICYGLAFFKKIAKLEKDSPCSCVIGTYTTQSRFDIEKRYKLFFKKLLQRNGGVNVKTAFLAMKRAYTSNSIMKRWAEGQRYVILTSRRSYYLPKDC